MQKPLQRWQMRFYRALLLGGGVLAALWLLARLHLVTVPVMVGFFVAWALNPAVVWLRQHRVPAVVALMVPLGLLGSLLVLAVAVVVPTVGSQLWIASSALPARLQPTLRGLDPWTNWLFDVRVTDLIAPEAIEHRLQDLLRELAGPANSVFGWLLSSAGDILRGLGMFTLAIVVAAFLMDDYDRIVADLGELVPPRRRRSVFRILRRIDQTLMGFVRGEMLLFLLASLAFSAGLLALNVPFALLVGPLAGAIYLVPYVGVLTGAGIAASLSLLDAPSFSTCVGVLAVFGVFYLVDLLWITPRVIGGRVGLRPIVVLLGIIAGGELLGIVGILLAVPVLAVGRILLQEAVAAYRASPTFLGPEALADGTAGAYVPSPPRETAVAAAPEAANAQALSPSLPSLPSTAAEPQPVDPPLAISEGAPR